MTVEVIAPAQVKARLNRGEDLVLLDCREPKELALARIEGALHIPMGDIPSRLPQLDPDREYVVFCHHGQRSASVTAFLKQQDFSRVASMAGGIDAWAVDVDRTVPRY